MSSPESGPSSTGPAGGFDELLVGFGHALRAAGLPVGTDDAAIDTLGAVVKDRDDLEYASKSIQDVVA